MKKPPAWGGFFSGSGHYRVVQFFDRPQVVNDASGHRGRHFEAAVNPAEVVVGHVQRHRSREVFELL